VKSETAYRFRRRVLAVGQGKLSLRPADAGQKAASARVQDYCRCAPLGDRSSVPASEARDANSDPATAPTRPQNVKEYRKMKSYAPLAPS
jgi:hypothetical protein